MADSGQNTVTVDGRQWTVDGRQFTSYGGRQTVEGKTGRPPCLLCRFQAADGGWRDFWPQPGHLAPLCGGRRGRGGRAAWRVGSAAPSASAEDLPAESQH